MATYKISDIKSIGVDRAAKLTELGISTVDALLEAGKTKKGRKVLTEQMGELGSAKLVLNWVNRADLFRIKGISGQYSDLLERAGIDTVKELAQRNVANLHAKLVEVNTEKEIVKRLPTLAEVEKWVLQAKELPRGIEY
ncbi:MAG: DUF4332 domain-containing protein [Candidatus Promineifilaceae bacterium]